MAADAPDEFRQTIAAINRAHERVFRLLAEGPAEVLFHSDNLSSDVQSPAWVERYSGEHYRTMAEIAHEHGKPLVTHIDGRLRGLCARSPRWVSTPPTPSRRRPGATSLRSNAATRPGRDLSSPAASRRAVSAPTCRFASSTSKSTPGWPSAIKAPP